MAGRCSLAGVTPLWPSRGNPTSPLASASTAPQGSLKYTNVECSILLLFSPLPVLCTFHTFFNGFSGMGRRSFSPRTRSATHPTTPHPDAAPGLSCCMGARCELDGVREKEQKSRKTHLSGATGVGTGVETSYSIENESKTD